KSSPLSTSRIVRFAGGILRQTRSILSSMLLLSHKPSQISAMTVIPSIKKWLGSRAYANPDGFGAGQDLAQATDSGRNQCKLGGILGRTVDFGGQWINQ